jgi:hypothetical protein
MAKKQYSAIAIIVLALFLGVAAMILYMPSDSGKAAEMPPIEDKFRMYFLATALVNHQANQAVTQIELDMMKHEKLQKTPQEYFGCPALLSNIKKLREARTTVMNDFSHLAEMNCFYAVSDADLKKFRLLEDQCRSKTFNPQLPEELRNIYEYQKKALNTGCMKHSGLQELLRSTRLIVTQKNGRTTIQIQK